MIIIRSASVKCPLLVIRYRKQMIAIGCQEIGACVRLPKRSDPLIRGGVFVMLSANWM
ncbi:hypothetical protein DESC_70019 [Desulfosarcina cetonica]|nr:hypothetical protein DESC_70019 [Desulfosarcina cetonica]